MTRLRAEDGVTLVELLVTMLILGVVFGATLTALEAMGHQSKLGGARSDAQDGARTALDQISQRLRGAVSGGASAVDRSATNDLVFRVVDDANPPVSGGANAQRLMFERFCVDAGGKLYEQVMHWTTASATVPAATTCPGAISAGGWETSRLVVKGVTTAGGAIFGYLPDAATPSKVSLDVSVDPDTSDATPPTRLRSAISLRNLDQPPTATINCVGAGSGQVLCDSGGTADPDGQPLTYQWSFASGGVAAGDCVGTTSPVGTGLPQLNQPGLMPGPYCFKLVASDPTGMSDTEVTAVTAQ